MQVCNVVTNGAAVPLLAFAIGCARPVQLVRIDGSPGVAPLISALVAEYRSQHPRARIELGSGLGSSARIQALAEGRIDVAMASHGVVAEELQRKGLVAHEIAR